MTSRRWNPFRATVALLLAIGCGDGAASGTGGRGGAPSDGGVISDLCDDSSLCTDLGAVLELISVNDYVLVGAQARVEADNKRFEFHLKWLGEGQGALGGCSILGDASALSFSADFAEETTRANGNTFSIFSTTPFEVRSGSLGGGAELQLGLFEFGTSQNPNFLGTEYVLVPTGNAGLWCRAFAAEDSGLRCDLGWFGVVSRSPIDPMDQPGDQFSTGVVNVTCLFARRDGAFAGCLEDCFDDNPCTYDYCDPETAKCTNTPIEFLPLSDVVSLPQDPLIPEVVDRTSQRCTTDQGELGLCVRGACMEYPCEDGCRDEWSYSQDEDRCTFEGCGNLSDPMCVTLDIDGCRNQAGAN